MLQASEFERMAVHVGLVDRSDRVRLEITGPDRAKFLHNLTTNEVKRLAVGRGCEAFVTSPQGKTIGYVIILAAEDRIIVRADPGGMELALPHFRKYGVFDDVAIDDRTAATFELHLFGPGGRRAGAAGRRPAAGGSGLCARRWPSSAGSPVRWSASRRPGCPGLTVIGERGGGRAVKESLVRAGRDLGLIEVDAGELRSPADRGGDAGLRQGRHREKPAAGDSAATTARSASSRAATWARRPSRGSMRWGTSTRS